MKNRRTPGMAIETQQLSAYEASTMTPVKNLLPKMKDYP